MESVEKESYIGKITEQELITLEYLSKTVLGGLRPYELEILKHFLNSEVVYVDQLKEEFKETYGYEVEVLSLKNAIEVLQGKFVSREDEYKKYCHIDILDFDENKTLKRLKSFAERLKHIEFYKQVKDIIDVGLRRVQEKYIVNQSESTPFVLYEKYSRRDVSLLMNCGRDLSSIMYGMKRIDHDVFIFVTYHKEESSDNRNYVDGKPDYADTFEDNRIFRWDSQIGRGIESTYVTDVISAPRKHLLVKKSDAESYFYYMGQFDVIGVEAASKKDNNGKERDITKFQMKMHHAVREDLLRYLQSKIRKEEEKTG